MLVAQGNLPEALKSFRDSLAIQTVSPSPIRMRLAARSLGLLRKDRRWLVAQGNLPEALKSFRDSLAITDRLAKADPGNAGWQRDLSVSYDRVGDVLVAQGNPPEALTLPRQPRDSRPSGHGRSWRCRLASDFFGSIVSSVVPFVAAGRE